MKKRICLSWLHPEALFVQMAKVRNLIETFCVVFYRQTDQTNKERPFNKASPQSGRIPLYHQV
jgi:hypothetical protein